MSRPSQPNEGKRGLEEIAIIEILVSFQNRIEGVQSA
jgi:hypothetical protein